MLLKVERRGELSEEETRGLTADRAVAPLVITLACTDVRREEEGGGTLWSADDILSVTLGTLQLTPLCVMLTVVSLACLVARHVNSTSIIMMGSMQFQSESLDQVKNFLHNVQPIHLPYP